MGTWYWAGVAVGLALAVGVLAAGLVGGRGPGAVVTVPVALVGGAAVGVLVAGWPIGAIGVVGAVVGALAGSSVVVGAIGRGGTASGVAALSVVTAALLAAISFVPIAGYVLVLAVPVAARWRSRARPERHAGLRTLAK